jgi:membrane protease YdiL (CAAX protease family)
LISGAIWAAWHVPVIVGADYNSGTPAWFAIPCFAVSVISMAFPLAWLRMRSASVWPATILHASHNLFIQSFFDQVTVDTGPTKYLVGEFGALLAGTIAVTAWLVWRARRQS